MSIDLISLLLIITIAQGIFLMAAILMKRPFGRMANRILFLLLVIFLWLQLEFLAVRSNFRVGLPMFYISRFGAWYAIGPLLWLYTKAYLHKGQFHWERRYWIHFLPFLIITLLIPSFWHDLLLTWRVPGYGMLTVFDRWNDEVTLAQYTYGVFFIAQFIHAFIYSLLSLRFIQAYQTALKTEVSNIDFANLRWLRVLHFMIIVVLTGAAIFIAYLFIQETYRRDMDYFFVLPITLFTYFFGFKAMLSPRQVVLPDLLGDKANKYSKSSLSKEHSEQLLHHVLTYMDTQRPYLNSNLRLGELSEAMELSPHHLSQIINENLKQNFYDFVNQYRIKAAKELIHQHEHYTLLQVAMEVGFNNKTSFNNAFKKHAGMSPSQFKKQGGRS